MLFHPISKDNQILRLLLASLFSVSIATAQQSNCSLRLDRLPDAPELRGFHMGMTYDQVKSRVPQIQFGRVDEFGVSKTSISPFFDPRFDKASFADVRTISLDFLDGKLVTLWIGYESTFKWKTLDEFVAGISKSLNLTAEWAAIILRRILGLCINDRWWTEHPHHRRNSPGNYRCSTRSSGNRRGIGSNWRQSDQTVLPFGLFGVGKRGRIKQSYLKGQGRSREGRL